RFATRSMTRSHSTRNSRLADLRPRFFRTGPIWSHSHDHHTRLRNRPRKAIADGQDEWHQPDAAVCWWGAGSMVRTVPDATIRQTWELNNERDPSIRAS